jgi:hypothetical protein
MDLLAFEHDRGFVVKALRRGEIDYLEPVTEAVAAGLGSPGRELPHAAQKAGSASVVVSGQ